MLAGKNEKRGREISLSIQINILINFIITCMSFLIQINDMIVMLMMKVVWMLWALLTE